MRDVIHEAGVRSDIFNDPDNLISYPDAARLLAVSARHSHCSHIGLLVGQHGGLATMGLVGQMTRCADTAGQALQRFAGYFSLQNTAATVSLITSSGFTRLVYAITEPDMGDSSQLQLGAMALGFNVMQDLCGPAWVPAVVTIACSAPANLRPCQKFFRAPLRFDSDESALVFDSRWLDRRLPSLDALDRRRIESEAHARLAALAGDFPATVRRLLRRLLQSNECSMDLVAALLGMHRRTLDRKLKRHGALYGELLDSVKRDVACQLLRDTHLPLQQVAESLRYTSAANFSTAFRRWTGVTPSVYRRQAR